MTAPTFDLQSHSTHSDGVLEPAGVVATAAAAGVQLLALSDHDSVDGVPAALQAAGERGLTLVPAVELSTVDETAADLHLLGYRVDHTDPALLGALREFRADRDSRADRMTARLRDAGLQVDDATLNAHRARGGALGRPHLAEAVLAAPANAQRLAAEAIEDVSGLIRGYLIAGRPGFAGRTKPSVADAIALVHAAGGVAVWAHPFWDVADPDTVRATLQRFADAGLDGVEAFYVTHDEPQTSLLVAEAQRLDLLMTGSADFHGPEHKRFSRFRAFDTFGHEPRLGPIAA